MTRKIAFVIEKPWRSDRRKDDPPIAPLSIRRHRVTEQFAVVLKEKDTELFWTGPKTKTFIAPYKDEFWTTKDRNTALVVAASFMLTNSFKKTAKSASPSPVKITKITPRS